MLLAEKIDTFVQQVLRRAENQSELLIGTCQSEVKMTSTQEHILMLLQEENLTNTELAKRLHVTQAAVTKAVKLLVSEGMLEPLKNKVDARQTHFSLTAKALPIAKEHQAHHEKTLAVYKTLVSRFSKEEVRVIDRFISDLLDVLEE